MAVHVPLSVEAQLEARLLMLATNNIFSPSSGRPITTPSQDITLGCYYLTQGPRRVPGDAADKSEKAGEKKRLPIFGEIDEVLFAHADKVIGTHELILLRNPDFGTATVYGDKEKSSSRPPRAASSSTRSGPRASASTTRPAGKKNLSDIILRAYQVGGREATVESLDKLKELGFAEATKAGISIGIDDMIIPEEKNKNIAKAYESIAVVEKQYRSGAITDGERYNKIVDIWTQATDEIASVMFRTLDNNLGRREYNPLYMMVDSGARGNRQQVRQLAGIRGLMAKPSGDIIERPIVSNFREGPLGARVLHLHHGARKGLADTALKTADAGYMTRKLHDVAQDVIVNEPDCGTVNGIWVKAIYEGDEEIVRLADRIYGRVSCDDITDPVTRKPIVRANELIDEPKAQAIEADRHRAGQDPLRPHLRDEERHLRELLRPEPGHEPDLEARRGGRRHRRPVDRRARNAAPPCARSTSAARRRRSSSSPRSRRRTTAR